MRIRSVTDLRLVVPVVGCALLLGGTALAQGTVYTFEEEQIRVEIEKPEAFYILSPSNLDYESMPAEETFLPELYETVEEEPF